MVSTGFAIEHNEMNSTLYSNRVFSDLCDKIMFSDLILEFYEKEIKDIVVAYHYNNMGSVKILCKLNTLPKLKPKMFRNLNHFGSKLISLAENSPSFTLTHAKKF